MHVRGFACSSCGRGSDDCSSRRTLQFCEDKIRDEVVHCVSLAQTSSSFSKSKTSEISSWASQSTPARAQSSGYGCSRLDRGFDVNIVFSALDEPCQRPYQSCEPACLMSANSFGVFNRMLLACELIDCDSTASVTTVIAAGR